MTIIERCRAAYTDLLTWLNSLGLMLLLYVMQTPNAPAELVSFFPEPVRPFAKVLLPFAWFLLVQHATKKVRANGERT